VAWKTQPGEQGVTVTLTVREAPEQQVEIVPPAGAKIQRVEIRGVTGARMERLAKLLNGVMNGREYRQEVVEEVAGPLVRTALAESAHWNPVVTFKQEDETRLAVEIDAGPVAPVGEITMVGGDEKWLAGAGYVKGEPAESKKLNGALGKVIEAARNDGYLAATARQENIAADGRLNLRVVMEMGPLYRFGELLIEGLPEQGEKRARALWKLKPGDAAGAAVLENWIRLVFEKRIPARDKVERQWKQRQDQAVADAVVAFR
jgi:hypothetical protein